jgi:hypothetical protein
LELGGCYLFSGGARGFLKFMTVGEKNENRESARSVKEAK